MRTGQVGRKALDVFASHGRNDWFRINNAADGPSQIYLYDDIGFFGTPASAFIDELADIKGNAIDVHLNSLGGDVFDGIAIYNALRQHRARVTVVVDSMAASIASVIAQAGDERVMVTGSQMMIHDAWGLAVGDADDLRQYADTLELQSENIAEIYAERTGGDAAEFRALMRAETWMRPKQAVELGLADRILKPDRQDQETTTDADAAAAKVSRLAAMLRQAEEITL